MTSPGSAGSGAGTEAPGTTGAGSGAGRLVLDGVAAAQALEHGVALVPAGRDVVGVEGPDAASYLQGQCSQDVEAIAVGQARPALLLSPQGKLQALVRLGRLALDRFVVDVDAGAGPAVVARLQQFRLRVKVDIAMLADWRCVALRGPGAIGTAAAVEGAWLTVPESHGELVGVDLLGPGLVPPPGVAMLSDPAWEAARVEAGIPTMGAELDERTIPAEAGLVEAAVSFTKGCFTGQELVARLDARGNKVARHLRGLVLQPVAAGGPVPAPGWVVATGGDDGGAPGKVVGRITSVARSARLGRLVALAYVHRTVSPPATVMVRPEDGGGPASTAEVRLLPLVGASTPGGGLAGGPPTGR